MVRAQQYSKRQAQRLLLRSRLNQGFGELEERSSCKDSLGAGEMTQWLRALTALPKDLSSNPSNHMVAHSYL